MKTDCHRNKIIQFMVKTSTHPMVCLHEVPVYVDVLCMMWKLFTGAWTNRRFSPFICYNCLFCFGCMGLCCFTGLSLVAVSRGYSLGTVAFLVVTHGLRSRGSVAVYMGLVAHVESHQRKDQTCVPCIGRWILNHWNSREVPITVFLN